MSGPGGQLTRRTMLRAASAAAVSAAGTTMLGTPVSAAPSRQDSPQRLFGELEEKIQAGMAKYAIPGVAVGVWYQGTEFVKGYGVTNVDNPLPVDGDTVFRVASTTKTFTATVIMRLVEAGKLDLNAAICRYLPDFRTLDRTVAERVTVRQVLNHSAGWLGDCLQDTGEDDTALERYVAALSSAPQLTEPGTVFAYNNAALGVAGRLIERVTGLPYETAARRLLIDPLGLAHSRYFEREISDFKVATSHAVVDGRAVADPASFHLWRAINPIGGLISSASDQLRYARFHLGDGQVPGGRLRLLSQQGLRAMRSNPGPGGTLFVELDGVGVGWMLRPSAEGVRIVQHGGDWTGQHSGFLMVPERDFAITVLTNSEGGPGLVDELFISDWALRRFAGISNLPAVPYSLTPGELAEYTGTYVQQQIGPSGVLETVDVELRAKRGHLVATAVGQTQTLAELAFYRPDYVVMMGPTGELETTRANFVRGRTGQVEWLRVGGRLLRRQAAGQTVTRTLAATVSRNPFLPRLS